MEYEVSLITTMGIGIIAALSLNLITGFCGQISLGHAAFLALGAYTAAVLGVHAHVPFWLALPLAGLVAAEPGEDHQGQGPDHRSAALDPEGDPSGGHHRGPHHEDDRQRCETEALPPIGEALEILIVAGDQGAGRHQARSTSGVPNRPWGRTTNTAIITR